MNFIDILLIIPIVYGAYKGFSRGFLIEIATLLGLFVGVFCAMRYAPQVEHYLVNTIALKSEYNNYIAWFITFLVTLLALMLLAWGVTKLVEMLSLGLINKLLGTFLGMVKYFIIVCVALLLVNFFNSKFAFIKPKHKQESMLYSTFSRVGDNIYTICKSI
ncbi:MAG: CvpA family protein [Marinifilaceae bacterium]